VWNDAAAHRLATLGHGVRQGDLVWTQTGQNKMEDSAETNSLQVRKVRKCTEIFASFFNLPT